MASFEMDIPQVVSDMADDALPKANNGMGVAVQKEFANMMKAMTEEEKTIALRNFPSDMLWTELKRRFDVSINSLNGIRKELHNAL